tara:strand:- start:2240 stop:5623 length:3384 start_codon:yes stop_codon:yes gene_type:complete
MADYTQKEEEYDFSKLVEDDDFKADLVKFFSGGRYNYSVEDMKEKGFEGLTEDFVTHMRYQSWNEVEAVRDLSYVKNKDMNPEGQKAFGRLISAWDNSDSAGQGFGDGVSDFAGAVLSAPSTYVGLGSFGLGKLGAKAATKATQLAVRFSVQDHLKKTAVRTGVQRAAGQSAKKAALKEAAVGFTTGATIGAVQAGAQGETREELDLGEYTKKDLLFDATVGGVIEGGVGAGLGYVSGLIGRGRATKVDEVLAKRKKSLEADRKKATDSALLTIKKATPEQKKAAMARVSEMEDILSARAGVKGAGKKDPLDPTGVAKGRALLNSITDPDADPTFSSGLSADTMRKIAAASVDLMNNKNLDTRGGERITQSVANAIGDGDPYDIIKFLDSTRAKYGLSKDEFSLIYLSEVSKAGQVLGYASAIKRGANLAGVDTLFEKGASSMSSDEMATIAKEAIKVGSKKGKTLGFFQDLDAMRIAFMTSQPVTTMRNMRNSGILIATDLVDQTNRVLYKGLTGDTKAIKDFIPNATALLRGYTTNNVEAKVIREILLEEGGEQYKRLFNDAMRIDVGLEGQSVMAKAGRFVNGFNTLTDSVLKEGMFYGALDRQLREKADTSLKDWISTNKSLDALPEGVNVDEAIEVANRFTMQRTFREDNSLLAKGTKGLVDLNRRMPFLISEGFGVPFPRYVGNHLQMVSEYTPILGEILQQTGVTSKTEDASLRYARQMTGAMMLFGGYQLAAMRGGEADYGTLKNTILNSDGMTEDMKPYLGSAMASMYIGDIAWRRANGLPAELDPKEIGDVLGGIPEFSFDFAAGTALVKYAAGGFSDSSEVEKEIGNLVSTFTYPGIIARDVYGQLNPDAAGSAYVRDLALSSDVNTKGAGGSAGVFTGQATRMLMDTDMLQYTQSLNGENDIQYYRFSNPVAIARINPALKQIMGSSDEPAPTVLEEEMSKMGIKDWKIYNNRTAPNANVDLLLRKRLARGNPTTGEPGLADEFSQWKSSAPASKRFGNMTYDEIVSDPNIPGSEKKELLEGWIRGRIGEEQERIETMFNSYVAQKPIQARGYIRNNYTIMQKKEGKHVFDLAASKMGFKNADEMITSSENVSQEISRRLKLLTVVPTLADNKPY